MSGEGLSAEEHLDVLKDEIFYASDRLSPSEARAVAHAVYNGDWLARREADAAAEAAEKALRDAADEAGGITSGYATNPQIRSLKAIRNWLNARADSVAQGREETPA